MIERFKNKGLLKNNIFITIGIFIIALFFVLVTPQRVYADGITTDGFTYSVDGSHATITKYQWKGGLPNITIPTTITSDGNTYTVSKIGMYAFYNDYGNDLGNLTSIVIPNSVTSIGYAAFENCSGLKKLTIPESVTSISEQAFTGCSNLTNVIIPNSVNSISNNEFSGCSRLTNVTIPDTITSIGSNSFSSCENLTTITLPNSVTSIGYAAFDGCTSLTKMTIPSSVTFIDSNAFSECTLLGEVNFWGNAPSTGNNPLFSDCSPSFKVYYLSGNTGFTNPWEWCPTEAKSEAAMNNYTATFNSQGGSTVSNGIPTSNSTIIAPTVPTKTNYTFIGWYKEVGCLNAWNFVTDTVTSNTTLYAKWIINNYTATFNSQGGSAVSNENADYNNVIIAPVSPTKTGYTFGGWYKEARFLNVWNFVTDTLTSNTTLYAKWIFNYSDVVGITYQGHVQKIGWQPWVSDGQEAGTDGKSLRVEALNIKLTGTLPEGASIQYQGHVQKIGWQPVVSDGAEIGTDGKSLRVEAIKIALNNMPGYSVKYRAHVQKIGWQPWVSDGQEAGTDGKSLRIEALEIKIVKTTDGSTPIAAAFSSVTSGTIKLPSDSQIYNIIDGGNADINGDFVKENIILAGIKSNSWGYNGLALIITDPKTGNVKTYTKISEEIINEGIGDWDNGLFLNDYTGDGISDIRLNLNTGSNSAMNHCLIFSEQSGELKELYNKSLDYVQQNLPFSFEMSSNYILNITLDSDKSVHSIDLSKDEMAMTAISEYGMSLDPWLGGGPVYEDVKNDDGSYSLSSTMWLSGAYHADGVAAVNTIYKYDKTQDKFIVVNQQVTSSYPIR